MIYGYNDLYKDVLINWNKQFEDINECKYHLSKTNKLKSYIIEFETDGAIKHKIQIFF